MDDNYLDNLIIDFNKSNTEVIKLQEKIKKFKENLETKDIIKYSIDNKIDIIKLKGGHLKISVTKQFKQINKKNIIKALEYFDFKEIKETVDYIYNREFTIKTSLKFQKV